MAGRRTKGPALVEQIDGSQCAKDRAELIYSAMAGQLTVVAAAKRLGISQAMFYKLRKRLMRVSVAEMEPKTIGRPRRRSSPAAQRQAELETRIQEPERELQAQSVRLELAQSMPQIVQSPVASALKKTDRKARLKRFQAQRRALAQAAQRKQP